MLFSGTAALAMTLVISTTAFAGWNDAPTGDCSTFSIGNVTTNEGITSPCWNSTNISAKAGDTVNVKIYFHNTSTTTANNVSVKISNPGIDAVSGSKSFSGSLYANGSVVATGSGSINVTGYSAKFKLTKVVVQRQSNGMAVETLANPESIFSGNGINIGSVAGGWNGQGVVKAVFVLETATTSVDLYTAPSVTTYTAQPISNELGNAKLRGYYAANGTSVTTSFRYRRDGGSWNTVGTQNRGISEGTFDYQLTGLASGFYEFQAVAANSTITKYGNTLSFTISNNNDPAPCATWCGDIYEPVVETREATNVDSDSATLRGRLLDNGNDDNEVYFEWGTSTGNLSHTTSSDSLSSETTFSQSISGLASDRTYYFRACAQNSEGTDCGSIESFTTESDTSDYCDIHDCTNNDETSRPSVTTLGTISVGSSTVVVDGYYDANGCSATTYFQYGRTENFGNKTGSVNRGNNSGSMAQSFTGLSSNTKYYFRAVAENCEGTSYGSTRSFTTSRTTTVIDTNTDIVTTGGLGGNSMVRLTITNNREIVRAGREVGYDVTWTNISGRKLENLVLEVNFPEQMKVIDTDRGLIERNTKTVIYEIDSLDIKETGEMTILTETGSGLRDGDPVVAQAIMAFENPKTTATENAIAYDADEFSNADSSVLGASLFGLTFFPTSLAGWLLVILIILLIVILARYFMRKNDTVINNNPTSNQPATPAAGASTQDYIVYRPTPKQ